MGKVAGAVFVSSLPLILKKMEAAEIRVMKEAVNVLRNETIRTLSGERHGKRYKVPRTKHQYYTASRAGEPPAVRLGDLKGSVHGRVEASLFDVEGQVGTRYDYGRILETRMDRVWLELSARKAMPEVKRTLGSRWF